MGLAKEYCSSPAKSHDIKNSPMEGEEANSITAQPLSKNFRRGLDGFY